MITNELLSRQLARMPTKAVPDAQDLYEVLASNSVALQQSAYRILHDHIPNAQEQISIDKALSKDYIARMPEELLSLILAAPSDEVLLEADFQRSTPAPLQSYLLCWKLVFDHWKGSSYSVQADYATALKDGEYLKNLLDFTSEHLITGRSRPVDPSKLDIMEFTPDQEDTPEKDLQCFLTHLYALSLICVPNLSKLWWRDSTSRQTMLAVESWTEKYVRLACAPSLVIYLHIHTRSRRLSSPRNLKQSARGLHHKPMLSSRFLSRSQRRPAKSQPQYPSTSRRCQSLFVCLVHTLFHVPLSNLSIASA